MHAVLDGRGNGSHEAVCHQDAQEGAYQCGSDLATDGGRIRATDGRHCIDDTEHGRHDAEAW